MAAFLRALGVQLAAVQGWNEYHSRDGVREYHDAVLEGDAAMALPGRHQIEADYRRHHRHYSTAVDALDELELAVAKKVPDTSSPLRTTGTARYSRLGSRCTTT